MSSQGGAPPSSSEKRLQFRLAHPRPFAVGGREHVQRGVQSRDVLAEMPLEKLAGGRVQMDGGELQLLAQPLRRAPCPKPGEVSVSSPVRLDGLGERRGK